MPGPQILSRTSSRSAAANTSSGVSSVMQRWSSGQTRSWHGPHGTGFCRWTARGWYVSVQAMWVGPKRVITGRSKAAALVADRLQAVGQERAAAVAVVADAPPAAA